MTDTSQTEHPPDSKMAIGIALAIAGTTMFAAKAIVIKLAMAEGADVNQLLTMRMLFSVPIFSVVAWFAWRARETKPTLRQIGYVCMLGVLCYHVSSWLDFQGLNYISAQLERLILFVYPTFVALLSWAFLKEPLTPRHAMALALSYGGVFLLFGSEAADQGPDVVKGSLFVLAAACTFSIFMVMSRSAIKAMGSSLFTSIMMIFATITIMSHLALEASVHEPPNWTPAIIVYGAILALFCTAIPAFMMSEAIARLGPGKTSAVSGVSPVITAGMAVVLLGESFGWPHAGSITGIAEF